MIRADPTACSEIPSRPAACSRCRSSAIPHPPRSLAAPDPLAHSRPWCHQPQCFVCTESDYKLSQGIPARGRPEQYPPSLQPTSPAHTNIKGTITVASTSLSGLFHLFTLKQTKTLFEVYLTFFEWYFLKSQI